MFVGASNQSGSLCGLPQSEWFLLGLCSSWVVPQGEQFVCRVLEFTMYEGDAQLIIELLHEHHTGNSQYSRSEINRITKYLTNIKLDDTWRGTNESFLMHYNDQLCLLDSLVDSDEKLPDNTRVTFLESAVESVPDLRRVKITDNVLQAQLDSTRPITYRSYFDLLKDAAFHLIKQPKEEA